MKSVAITVRMPLYTIPVGGTFSKVEKPTGLQYLLLTMIDSDFTKSMVWNDVIRQFSIPTDVFEGILVPEIRGMPDMLRIHGDGNITVDSRVSDIQLTPEGREALGKGVLAEKIENFSGNVLYLPSFNDRRRLMCNMDVLGKLKGVSEDDKGVGTSFEELDTDSTEFLLEVENAVRDSKGEFGIDDDSDIMSMDVRDGRKVLFFDQRVNLAYNEKYGTFSVTETNVNELFIRSFYTVEYLLSSIDHSNIFSVNAPIRPMSWRDKPPEMESYNVLLPCQFEVAKTDRVLVNPDTVRADGAFSYTADSLGDLPDYDMVLIGPTNSGYGFYFAESEAKVSGMEGSYRDNYIFRVPLDAEQCARYIRAAFDNYAVKNDEDFDKTLGFIKDSCDKDYLSGFARRYLSASKSIPVTVIAMKKYWKDQWFTDAVEYAIADNSKTIEDLGRNLSAMGDLHLGGGIIFDRMGKADGIDRMQLVDLLLSHADPKTVPAYALSLSGEYCRMVLGESPPPEDDGFRSAVMNSIVNASRNLERLKTAFGIVSFSEHSFDLEELAVSGGEYGRYISTFLRETDSVRGYLSASPELFRDIKRYREFFADVRGMFDTDYSKMTNARMFGWENGPLLESILRPITEGGDLVDMIGYAYEKKMVSESDYKALEEFRLFRNKCAHEITVPVPDAGTKKRWLGAINRLKNITSEGGETDES